MKNVKRDRLTNALDVPLFAFSNVPVESRISARKSRLIVFNQKVAEVLPEISPFSDRPHPLLSVMPAP
jgi:hypothetical protein